MPRRLTPVIPPPSARRCHRRIDDTEAAVVRSWRFALGADANDD